PYSTLFRSLRHDRLLLPHEHRGTPAAIEFRPVRSTGRACSRRQTARETARGHPLGPAECGGDPRRPTSPYCVDDQAVVSEAAWTGATRRRCATHTHEKQGP